MGIKSTRDITRQFAIDTLLEEIPKLSNQDLADMMTQLGDCPSSDAVSMFDNFMIEG